MEYKKVNVFGYYGKDNLGDDLILLAQKSLLSKYCQNIDFFAFLLYNNCKLIHLVKIFYIFKGEYLWYPKSSKN